MKKIVILCISLIFLQLSTYAQEYIDKYEVKIKVEKDRSVLVEEILDVEVKGVEIKHGIFREIPNVMQDSSGEYYRYPIDVLEVTRNGNSGTYEVDNRSNYVNIKIGNENILLTYNTHTYRILYRMMGQVRFFEDHDELYWNVTGNFWNFPIQNAIAYISLPAEAEVREVFTYSGVLGNTSCDCEWEQISQSQIKVTMNRPLQPKEGLTVAVTWDKGIIPPATPQELANEREHIKRGAKYSLPWLYGGIFISFLYFLFVWYKVGVDPKKGAIIPRWEPPRGLSPGTMRFIYKMGYDRVCFTSSIINLAINGFISISQDSKRFKKEYTLWNLKPEKPIPLAPEEKAVYSDIFKRIDDMVVVNRGNELTFSTATTEYEKYLNNNYKEPYFSQNLGWFGVGCLLSIASFVFAMYMLGPFDLTAFLALSIIAFFFIYVLIVSKESRWMLAAFALFFLIASIAVGRGINFAETWVFLPATIALPVMNVVFLKLIPAPTKDGRKLMDEIEGFKMYLETAEKDRLNLLNPPEENLQLFEKLFPYALALDVDQQWSERFSDQLKTADYEPNWYHGYHNISSFGAAVSGIGSSLSSSITSASSSGSSGGSGGGSGGGGGGGW